MPRKILLLGREDQKKSDSNPDTNILDPNDDQDDDKVEKIFWAPFQRHWYVARKAHQDEIPTKLKNKAELTKQKQVVIQFLGDQTYSMIPEAKLEPFGDTELDKRRAKGDSKGVAATLNLNLPSLDSPSMTSSRLKDNADDEDDRSENCPNHNGGIIESIAQKLKPRLDHESDELEAI